MTPLPQTPLSGPATRLTWENVQRARRDSNPQPSDP